MEARRTGMRRRNWGFAACVAFSLLCASVGLVVNLRRTPRSLEAATKDGVVRAPAEIVQSSVGDVQVAQQPYPPDHITVLEDLLPEDAYHQEPGACQVGSRVWLVTGIAVPRTAAKGKAGKAASLGTAAVHVFDMETQTVATGPPLPVVGNHMACAAAADGTIHVTGGFRQDAPVYIANSHRSWRHHFTLNTTDRAATWRRQKDMPEGRGGHGCAFMADGNMYCVGGGGGQWGPFHGSTFVYSPGNDSWWRGPDMDVGRDHVTLVRLAGGTQLMAIGGRSDLLRSEGLAPHPTFWQTMDTVEVLDLALGEWAYAASVPTVKASVGATTVRRSAAGDPNVLVVGGETHLVFSGLALASIEEYDVERGVWFCHAPLPHAFFGGIVASHGNKVFVIGGGDWFAISPTRRVQVIDMDRAPAP